MGGIIAGVLAGRGCSALVFRGFDGLDELTTTGPSAVWVVHDGQVAQTEFSPGRRSGCPWPRSTTCAAVTPPTTRPWPARSWPASGARYATSCC